MPGFLSTLIYPFELLVSWILFGFHELFTLLGMNPAGGWTWTLSIIGLVLVMRAAMIPLFVKQIKASRKMQMIQPELQKIQKKYKGKTDPESRQAMTQETMELYRREGTNPFSSCMPILVQTPFFFGLYQVLAGLQPIAMGQRDPIGPITRTIAAQAESATIFGAQLSDTFTKASTLNTQILTIVLIVAMSASQFIMQRQLVLKNMPASALDNPFAKQQKMLIYIFPVIFAVTGINFPIGVLLYWLTTNVWSLVQQFYVIRNMPAPGSEAERAYHDRLRRKGKPIPGEKKDAPVVQSTVVDGESESAKASRQRVQPKGKKRAKKSGGAGGTGTAAGGGSTAGGSTAGGSNRPGSEAAPDSGPPASM